MSPLLRRPLAALLFLAVAAGCNKSSQVAGAPVPADAPVVPVAPVAAPPSSPKGPLPAPVTGPPKGFGTPAELYAGCKSRVEGADLAGECASDADCVTGGCSQELCVSTTQAAEGMMSTCEMRPCFQVLENCGCVEGVCSWQVGGE